MSQLLLRMVTGSRLYGVERADSDWDIKEIFDHCKPARIMTGNQEIVQWPLSMLMKVADRGGHNGLEVLFSAPGWPEVDLLGDFRAGYRTNYWICLPRFKSAQKTLQERRDIKGFKRAIMMEDWLAQIADCGRFNPHWGLTQH